MGLVGHWRLDEGEGLVAFDSGPLHHDAALGNELVAPAEWFTYDPPALP